MCLGCPAYCCRGPIVDLTSYDIFRIALASGKDAGGFAEYIAAAPDDAFGFRISEGMAKFVLRQPDRACVFLTHSGQPGCAIEEYKPSICLCYPFSFKDGRPYLRTNILCPPHNRLKVDFNKMSAPALAECDWEFKRYGEIVGDWNLLAKGTESAEDFLSFAAGEMQLETSPWGSICRRAKRLMLRLRKR